MRALRSASCLTLMAVCCIPATVAYAQSDSGEDAERVEPSILVTGRPIENYMAVDAMTGTKMNALLKDIPLSVSIVPYELIEDRSISYLGEALDTVSGAQRKLGYGGVQNFGAYLRGFDAGFLTLRNGVRDFGFYTLRDSANVERFEVLKGPGSVLYGAVTPGGITNTVTKKPTPDPLARLSVIAGSNDYYRGELDVSAPLSDTIGVRLNASVEDTESFRDQVEAESYFLAPVVSWKIGTNTDWIVELEHKHSEYTWDLGLVRDPVVFDLPISRFLGEPDGLNTVDSTYVSSVLEHRFNDQWALRQTTGYTWTDGDYNLRSVWGLSADKQTGNRVAYDTWEKSHTFVAQNELVGEFGQGGLDHQLVMGLEYYDVEQSYEFIFQSLDPIDLFNPVYGAQPGDGFPLFADEVTSQAYGFYVQDLVSIGDKIKLLFGGRYDSVDSRSFDLLGGAVSRESSDDAFSPQAGMVYQPDPATSFYVSYGESFAPITSGTTANGDYLDPEEGQQFEVGAKRFWFDGKLLTTLAIYEITKQNVSTPDPDNPNFRVQTGEQRSRGVELDISGSPTEGLDMVLAMSVIDAEVTEDNTFAVGSQLPGAAEFTASFWTKYTLQSGFAEGVSVGGGIFHVGDRQPALPNTTWLLPSYTRFDAMVSLPLDPFTIQLNVNNITDEDIYDLTSTSILPQAPRSVFLRLSYDF